MYSMLSGPYTSRPPTMASSNGSFWSSPQCECTGTQRIVYVPVRRVVTTGQTAGCVSISLPQRPCTPMFNPISDGDGCCHCDHPRPVQVPRMQLPLCGQCTALPQTASPYVPQQFPAAPQARPYTPQRIFSATQPRPSSPFNGVNNATYQLRRGEWQPSEARDSTNFNPVTPIGPPSDASIRASSPFTAPPWGRKSDMTDQVQQYPSQVYIGGLLQPNLESSQTRTTAADESNVDFEQDQKGEEQPEEKPEDRRSDLGIPVEFHFSLPILVPSTAKEGQGAVGVGNIPITMPLNFQRKGTVKVNQEPQDGNIKPGKPSAVTIVAESDKAGRASKVIIADLPTGQQGRTSASSKSARPSAARESSARNTESHASVITKQVSEGWLSLTFANAGSDASGVGQDPSSEVPAAANSQNNEARQRQQGNSNSSEDRPREQTLNDRPSLESILKSLIPQMGSQTPDGLVSFFHAPPENWMESSIADTTGGVEVITEITREVSLQLEDDSNSTDPSSSSKSGSNKSRSDRSPKSKQNSSNSSKPRSEPRTLSNKSITVLKPAATGPSPKPSVSVVNPGSSSKNSRSSQARAHHRDRFSSPNVPKKPSSDGRKRRSKRHMKVIHRSNKKSGIKVPSKHSIRRSTTRNQRQSAGPPERIFENPQRSSITVVDTVEVTELVDVMTGLPNTPLSVLTPVQISLTSTRTESHDYERVSVPGKSKKPSAKPVVKAPKTSGSVVPAAKPSVHDTLRIKTSGGELRVDQWTSVEYSKKTQTDLPRKKPALQSKNSETSSRKGRKGPLDTYILCPQCCPNLSCSPSPCMHSAEGCNHYNQRPSMGAPCSSAPYEPCLYHNSQRIQGCTGLKTASMTERKGPQTRHPQRPQQARPCDGLDSLRFCVPGPDGSFDQVEHWILEPELVSLDSTNKKQKAFWCPKLRRMRHSEGVSDKCSSEYLILPQALGRNGPQDNQVAGDTKNSLSGNQDNGLNAQFQCYPFMNSGGAKMNPTLGDAVMEHITTKYAMSALQKQMGQDQGNPDGQQRVQRHSNGSQRTSQGTGSPKAFH